MFELVSADHPLSDHGSTWPHRLSPAEERRLFTELRASNDPTARSELIASYLWLVAAIARRYVGKGIALEDLIAEGNLGLVMAVDRFNPELGTRFSGYASYWIRHSICSAFARDATGATLSSVERSDLATLMQARSRYFAAHGRDPIPSELCVALGWTPERVRAADRLAHDRSRPRSLGGGSDADIASVRGRPDDPLQRRDAHRSRSNVLARLLASLSEREVRVLELRFGLDCGRPRSIAAVSAIMNEPQKQTAALIRNAIAKLAQHPHLATQSVRVRPASERTSSRFSDLWT